MKIEPNMLCVLVGEDVNDECRGQIVETVKYIGLSRGFGWNGEPMVVHDTWVVKARWVPDAALFALDGFAVGAANLRPISGPGIDITETTDKEITA